MKNTGLYSLLLAGLLFGCGDKDSDEITIDPETPKESPLPGGLKDGITPLTDDSLAFVLFAPGKESVQLIGDFNNWEISDAYKMYKDGDRFWLKIGGLNKEKEYICQYLIDETIRIADPYANKISDPEFDSKILSSVYPDILAYPSGKTTEIAMVVSTDRKEYDWKTADFTVENPENLLIYELLIRDFTEDRTINAVREKLPYLKNLGINAIELMPFSEFEGNDSWGYNPSFYFATDKAYGTSEDYKAFIDACHSNGIAVIMDIVLNHSYGQSPMVRMYQGSDGKVTSDNPWYNVDSPNSSYSWGYDFNHESQYTQQFVDSVCGYWLTQYKIDGFRFDFTKGFTNTPGDGWAYDAARIRLLKRMTEEIHKRKPDAVVIFEHLADNKEEKELADFGIYLWGNMNYNYCQATMGWENNSFNGTSYKDRGWTRPQLISYMESHDEERLMYKNKMWGNESGSYRVQDLSTGLQRSAAAAVIYLSFPGPKMIWQFGELGYDFKLGSSAEEGRLDKKPVRWDYVTVPERKKLLDVYSTMLDLKKNNPAFSSDDFTVSTGEGDIKQVLLRSANGYVTTVANLGLSIKQASVLFDKTGSWKELFTGEQIQVTEIRQQIEIQPGEYRLYISQ
ncbi:alpha-amylase family glycosyl hydrolase [Massilibacteroides sp.]|uniref:alpha-amylase family glycosyl hydrolase n=1 Tax=Massilibacteroides sp. TaxID=2034766 RepID=UPI00262620F1|nr:alpha-amylase family glycosyl hydrolase [Massilibacteroides sp.]MDD4516234.1 alpha-amylase family glycosyl hydrolase [Massilibacteroides sp.]